MAAVEAFYMCVYLKDGVPIGHRGGFTNKFPDNIHSEDGADANPKVKRSAMPDVWKEFSSTMMGYLEYVPIILELAPMVSHRLVTQSLKAYLEKNCTECDRQESRIIYRFDLDKVAAIKRFDENLSAAASTSRSLPRLLTVGLVTSLEYHIALVMKEIAARNPDAIFGRDKTLLVKDAVKFSSMEELKEHVINDEIDKAQRENLDAQIDWIINKTPKMEDFRNNYPDYPNIIELSERRNLYVHANGIVNKHYLNAGEIYKFPDANKKQLGDELHAGPKYFTGSVHRVFHFGAMLLQVVWRKLAPDEAEHADKAITNIGFELIVRGQYALAVRMLEFATVLRHVDELNQRMNVINLANAQKLAGDIKASEKTLLSMSWVAVSLDLKIGVAAVKGDVSEVVALMKKIGKDGDVTSQNYQEWPVFYGVRDNLDFRNTFKSVFGIDYMASAKRQAGLAQVLEWIEAHDVRDGNDKANDNVVELRPFAVRHELESKGVNEPEK